jgi:hypothetical protein
VGGKINIHAVTSYLFSQKLIVYFNIQTFLCTKINSNASDALLAGIRQGSIICTCDRPPACKMKIF